MATTAFKQKEEYCVLECGGSTNPDKCRQCPYSNYGRDCRNNSIGTREAEMKTKGRVHYAGGK